MVLIYNKSLEDQWGKLFSNRWNGPFKIKNQLPKGSYILEELDGVELKRAYAASHIKRFYPRGKNLDQIQQEERDKYKEAHWVGSRGHPAFEALPRPLQQLLVCPQVLMARKSWVQNL
ncbi:hypothetical protein PSTG_16050 [Puccinia striiformis f. sp. tritici PST-78]|uniref:Uncharacterized protein n=1 Tax=Puccinia striiformis f. sp. tritici PST-78 TaxID=1165861 RepID=A0A0L0UTW7_9BASI|nr:hypothetical protein PSTG_16050 [Puccinia striiformis f. sp. tritici PST-78]